VFWLENSTLVKMVMRTQQIRINNRRRYSGRHIQMSWSLPVLFQFGLENDRLHAASVRVWLGAF
jgi:hypothetical protein